MMRQVPLTILLLAYAAPVQAQHADMPYAAESELAAEPDPGAFADLFPNGAPNLLAPESIATSYRLPSSIPPRDAKTKVPTGLKYSDGPVKYEVRTNASANKPTTSIIPTIPDPKVVGGAAGGSGEVKGEVRFTEGQWELYGSQKFGVVQADGSAPSPQESTVFGSTYKLPAWSTGGKIGASLELAPGDDRKTRVEYRQTFGPAEGYVAAEQTFAPETLKPKAPVPTFRGGVTRKF